MGIRHFIFIFCVLVLTGVLILSFGSKHVPVILLPVNKSSAFDCTALNDKNVLISASDCNKTNGSITGIQGSGTGTLVYTWYNAGNTIVGTAADLTGVPAGFYRVVLKDSSKCTPVSLNYTIPENNPLRIDNTNVLITSPGCNQNNGSITNINVANAINYQWTDINTNIVSTGKDLLNAAAGSYVLTASNAAGCIAQARYTINPGSYAPQMTAYTYTNSDCKATGKFSATFNMKSTDPLYTYSIVNQSGKIIASGGIAYNPADSTRIAAQGLPADTYTFNAIGSSCFTKLVTFTIAQDVFKADTSNVVIRTDVCGQNVGVITGIYYTGGSVPDPLDPDLTHGYFWRDATNKVVGKRGFLVNVPSGKYTLTVVNGDGCVTAPVSFFVPDSISSASMPIVKDVKLCLPGTAALDVLNKDFNAHYRLYDSTKTLIDTSVAGYFARKVAVTTTFYIASSKGICPSPMAKVTVTVEDPGVSIPNAFTPNNDGVNDYWGIIGLGNFPGTEVTVFNRYGLRVYHSINYSTPFTGRYNGADLPDGVYYYIIDTKKPGCRGGVSGSLTIIR